MHILFSISYALNLPLQSGNYGGHEVTVAARSSDWGKNGIGKYPHYLNEAVQLLRKAQDYDAVALFTTGMEAFLLGKIKKLHRNRTRLVCADFLIPRKTPLLKLVADGLHAFSAFVCIRKGDMETLQQRFGIPLSRCSFAPFPHDPAVSALATSEGGYIYAAGWAHRDWPLLLRALEKIDHPALLSVGGNLQIPGSLRHRVRVLPQRSPEEGRRLMAEASVVVLPLRETELPSGPLVMLDAMAMGKAVVVTDVNGSRDYIVPGCTALSVPAGDSLVMASAINSLMTDASQRQQLGCAAREDVCKRFTMERFIEQVIKACTRK